MPSASRSTLFVWSESEVTGARLGAGARHRLEGGYGAGAGEPEYEARLILPEDQQSVVDLVQRIAKDHQASVKLIDLGKSRHFIERRKALGRGWTSFPVLVTESGATLAGAAAFSEETVRKALRRGTSARR